MNIKGLDAGERRGAGAKGEGKGAAVGGVADTERGAEGGGEVGRRGVGGVGGGGGGEGGVWVCGEGEKWVCVEVFVPYCDKTGGIR